MAERASYTRRTKVRFLHFLPWGRVVIKSQATPETAISLKAEHCPDTTDTVEHYHHCGPWAYISIVEYLICNEKATEHNRLGPPWLIRLKVGRQVFIL